MTKISKEIYELFENGADMVEMFEFVEQKQILILQK